MKTIEERANLAAQQIYILSNCSIERVSKIIAEKLSEQKAIDIDKACQWLTENTQCGVYPCSAYGFVDEFRKAMEE